MQVQMNEGKGGMVLALALLALLGGGAYFFRDNIRDVFGDGGNGGGGNDLGGPSQPSAAINSVSVSQMQLSPVVVGQGAFMGSHLVQKPRDGVFQVQTNFQASPTGSFEYRVKVDVLNGGQIVGQCSPDTNGEIGAGTSRTITCNFPMFLGQLAFVPSGSRLSVRARLEAFVPFVGYVQQDEITHNNAIQVL